MFKLLAALREILAEILVYVVVPGVVLGIVGYTLYGAYSLGQPGQKVHWSKGPQDPEPTH